MRHAFSRFVVVCALALTPSLLRGQQWVAENPPRVPLTHPSSKDADAAPAGRSRLMRVEIGRLAPGSRDVQLPLFDDRNLRVRFNRVEPAAGGRAWIGCVAGEPLSSVVCVEHEGEMAGSIHVRSGLRYELLPAGAGMCLVRELNADQPVCGGVLQDPGIAEGPSGRARRRVLPLGPAARAEARGSLGPQSAGPSSVSQSGDFDFPVIGCDDGSVIDVMIVYTPAARSSAGGAAAMNALANLAVADTNAAFERSLINTRLRLVHTQEVNYVETNNPDLDSARLIGTDDGFIDEVHALRNLHGADCVSLWLNTYGTAGYGYFPHPSLKGIGASGFTFMGYRGATGLTLAHEIGHNLWCAHDRANAPDPPYAFYSYGYREPGQAWHDIMAYPPGEMIPYFANPAVFWPGPDPPNPGPTGADLNQSEPSDLALTISKTRLVVANFRPTAYPGQPGILFVRTGAPNGGNGQSWATALNELDEALCRALGSNGAVEEIWVAAGTYTPHKGTSPRDATFQLVNRLAVYGGFAGNETQRGQRDPLANSTILSGDIGVTGDDSDNVFHVLTGSRTDESAVLDGFTITGGRANGGTGEDDFGGAMINDDGSPTVRNCTFVDNSATIGGAVYNQFGAHPTFVNCTFANNHALATYWPAGGGAVYNYDGCSPVFEGCRFTANSGNLGGAIACLYASSPQLRSCVFSENVAAGSNGEGGGAYFYYECAPAFDSCVFTSNSAATGGGIFAHTRSGLRLDNCTFSQNQADHAGGGIYQYLGPLTLTQCAMTGNSARNGGGLACDEELEARLTGCSFTGNTVDEEGGGLYGANLVHAILTGCTFAGNQALHGGGLYFITGCTVELFDGSVTGNTATETGGGSYHYGGVRITAVRCLFADNAGGFGGGMANLFESSATLVNCIFRKNASTGDAGAIAAYADCPLTLANCLLNGNSGFNGGAVGAWFASPTSLTNCTLAGNSSGGVGAVYAYQSPPSLANCILWNNRIGTTMTEPAQLLASEATPAIHHSIVQGWTGALGGAANSGSSPLFVDGDGADNVYGTADDNPHLSPGSPGIDTGDSAAVPAGVSADLDGGPRILGAAVDRGAYEFVPLLPADFDGDGDVDASDLDAMTACFSGPQIPRSPGCENRDFDSDGDVDQTDYGAFQRCYAGLNAPPAAGCATP